MALYDGEKYMHQKKRWIARRLEICHFVGKTHLKHYFAEVDKREAARAALAVNKAIGRHYRKKKPRGASDAPGTNGRA